MAETSSSSSKSKKSKKTKKNQYMIYGGAALGAGLVYYLWKKHQANTTAAGTTSAAGIDPLTGNPYTAGVGSLASTAGVDPATGQPYATGQGSLAGLTIDPTTGQTYASEISSLESQLGGGTSSTTTTPSTPTVVGSGQYLDSFGNLVEAATGKVVSAGNANNGVPAGFYQDFFGNILPASSLPPVTGYVGIGAGTGVAASPASGPAITNTTTVPPASKTLAQWTSAATNQLVAFGVSPASAAKSISQYLNGQAISDAHAAQGLTNITSAGNALGKPPVASGIAPSVRVAKAPTPTVSTITRAPKQTTIL
jgi:hypothetical protein